MVGTTFYVSAFITRLRLTVSFVVVYRFSTESFLANIVDEGTNYVYAVLSSNAEFLKVSFASKSNSDSGER